MDFLLFSVIWMSPRFYMNPLSDPRQLEEREARHQKRRGGEYPEARFFLPCADRNDRPAIEIGSSESGLNGLKLILGESAVQ